VLKNKNVSETTASRKPLFHEKFVEHKNLNHTKSQNNIYKTIPIIGIVFCFSILQTVFLDYNID